jgi:serine phosphatase RsbU (regulator of sigma subunit)
MIPETALIVSECNPTARDLWQVLVADGIPTQVRAPHTVMAESWSAGRAPDLLLVDATLDVDLVRTLVRRVSAVEHPPAVVSFAHADCDGLVSHIDHSHDYLIPPFLPHLVRSRLDTCRRHRDLGRTVRELSALADRREYERELQIGREIQRGFLPECLPIINGWEIAAHFEPAREVSGDFYDAYDIINGSFLGFAIADVCDKGIGAALFMALIRSLLRQAAVAHDAPPDAHRPVGDSPMPAAGASVALRAVETTNAYLTTNHFHQGYFATLFFGVVDPNSGEMAYVNCGHNPPIVRRANGDQTRLPPTGPALGLIHDARFELGSETLRDGDLLFLYTDGVPEAKSADGEFFGEERLHATLVEPGPAADVVERFTRAVTAHAGTAAQFDDVTMLGLRRQPTVGGVR